MSAHRFAPGISRLVVTGSDRRGFFQRMTTNDVEGLAPGRGCVTLLLERTGRLVDRLIVLERERDYLLLGTGERAQAVVEWIERYVIADDVAVRDVTDETFAAVVAGEGAAVTLAGLGLPAPEESCAHTEASLGDDVVTVVRDPGGGPPRFHVLAARAPEALAELPAGSPADWNRLRVEAALPAYGAEWDERTIPLEAGLAPAIDFAKGCYLGQEVVARLHNYDRIKRALVRLEVAGGDVPEAGAALRAGGADVGRITSAARVGGRVLALASVKRGHGAPGTELLLEDGNAATVTTQEVP